MPGSVVLLTQLFDRDEISSCVGSIVEKRNVRMIKPFLQKPHGTHKHESNGCNGDSIVHIESTHLVWFFGS